MPKRDSESALIRFTVPGPPVPKARARRSRRTGKWYTPTKTSEYEEAVFVGAMVAAGELHLRRITWPTDREYAVTVRCCFPDARKRDADNVLKSVLDACNKLLWRDDVQVRRALTTREIDRDNPRTEVTVEALEAVS